MKNFEFGHNGKKYWYQRGLVTILYVFAVNNEGDLYVLANKRGKGSPCNIGQWNCPCGHLDFDETLEECAVRECFEETGIKVNKDDIKLYAINSKPEDNETQNVGVHYYTILEGNIDDYVPNKEHMEKDEVEDIQWINVDNLDDYDFCFNHDKRIKSILKRLQDIYEN